MKFKGTLSDRGLRVLEKGFLPTLEKLGKRVQVLLGPEDVHLVQAPSDTDGLQVTARLANVRRRRRCGGPGPGPLLAAEVAPHLQAGARHRCRCRSDQGQPRSTYRMRSFPLPRRPRRPWAVGAV